MNINRRTKNKLAQSTAIALTAVMMSSQVVGAQAASIDYVNSAADVLTLTAADTTAGFTAALAQMNSQETTVEEIKLAEAVNATAGFTAALAEIQPDDVNLTLNLQGEALLSGVEEGVNKAAEEQAIAEEAAQHEAEAEAAQQQEAEATQEEEEVVQEDTTGEASVQTTTAAVVTQNEAVAATADDVTLLAALIQCEAGNECYEGQVAVGAVVLNRLHRGYAGSIYGVIYQPYQFGPAGSGKVAAVLASGPSATAIAAAQEALAGVDYTGGAVEFRNVRSGYSGTVIGNHVFF